MTIAFPLFVLFGPLVVVLPWIIWRRLKKWVSDRQMEQLTGVSRHRFNNPQPNDTAAILIHNAIAQAERELGNKRHES
jgi:hypothetical protein